MIVAQRMGAEIEGDFVVFMIGMRINHPWKIWKWLPVATAMPRMLGELYAHRELGLLHASSFFNFPNVWVLQYWRSFEHLHAYATNKNAAHLPAWRSFNRSIGTSGDVGIWHETYLISTGRYEAFYSNMPPHGLGVAGKLIEATGARKTAPGRLGMKEAADQPAE